ncbi:hypothetical protein [Corynebacterium tapiri]|uniref:Uncharacterized protein n=1 Tax=Corynebacterium tapiri TaxID=1448266 RepID=A0A5C4U846_9CORY|nr:hypothetical protein [Corynebacterium tapiri]TNM00541.1 hypothetical protein FHE74_00935 [Corynebacterium tapiri]
MSVSAISHANAWACAPLGSEEAPWLRVEVTLQRSAQDVHVIGPAGFLGILPPEKAQRFPDLERVFSSGRAPTTTAILMPRPGRSGLVDVDLELAPAPFIVPAGALPAGTKVFAQGEGQPVTSQLSFSTPCQILVLLDLVGSHVGITYNGRVLGGIDDPPAKLQAALAAGPVASRAFVANGLCALDIDPFYQVEDYSPLSIPAAPVLARAPQAAEPIATVIPTQLEPARGSLA